MLVVDEFMKKHAQSALSLLLYVTFTLISTGINTVYAATDPATFTELADQLDNKFINLSAQFYRYIDKPGSRKHSNIKLFAASFNRHMAENKPLDTTVLIINNVELLKDNLEHPVLFPVISHLLSQNEITTARELRSHANEFADKISNSIISFKFSLYYASRYKWARVLKLLENVDKDLDIEDANYAALLKGLALQAMKYHRRALAEYRKIPEKSAFYPAASLNIATVYLRQDWWTDAQVEIDELIKKKKLHLDIEALNRVYLFKGYLFLHKEYFREARDAFRKITLDSKYVNKALLGLVLAATNQQDFIGALNGVKILSEKKHIDIHVDESRILLPYIYEKLGQHKTASIAYTDSVYYYDSRINQLKTAQSNRIEPRTTSLPGTELLSSEYNLSNNARNHLNFIDENYHRLIEFKNILSATNNTSLLNKTNILLKDYAKLIHSRTRDNIKTRIALLESYRNQAKYGVARLFDNSSNNGGSNE